MDIQLVIIQLSIIVVGGIILARIQSWIKRNDRTSKIHAIKQDATIYALSNVNHGNFGQDFKPLFKQKYDELIKEVEFVEN